MRAVVGTLAVLTRRAEPAAAGILGGGEAATAGCAAGVEIHARERRLEAPGEPARGASVERRSIGRSVVTMGRGHIDRGRVERIDGIGRRCAAPDETHENERGADHLCPSIAASMRRAQ